MPLRPHIPSGTSIRLIAVIDLSIRHKVCKNLVGRDIFEASGA